MQPHDAFLQTANPHSWFLVAENLFSRSVDLAKNPTDMLTHTPGWKHDLVARRESCRVLARWLRTRELYQRPTRLRKSSLGIERNPLWPIAVTLSNKLHDLSKTVPYRNRMRWVLECFEAGLESWARYPCGLNESAVPVEAHLSTRLWQAYVKLAFAYGRRLQSHLSKGWRGPHGFHVVFDFEGSMFTHDELAAGSLRGGYTAMALHQQSVRARKQGERIPSPRQQKRRGRPGAT